jgi:hypothetical protein
MHLVGYDCPKSPFAFYNMLKNTCFQDAKSKKERIGPAMGDRVKTMTYLGMAIG